MIDQLKALELYGKAMGYFADRREMKDAADSPIAAIKLRAMSACFVRAVAYRSLLLHSVESPMGPRGLYFLEMPVKGPPCVADHEALPICALMTLTATHCRFSEYRRKSACASAR